MSEDLLHATVAVTVLGSDEAQRDALDVLGSASGFLRKALGKRLGLKRTPELRFVLDSAIREGDGVIALLDRIRDEANEPTSDKESEQHAAAGKPPADS
jgi:ribosome-binding factor A